MKSFQVTEIELDFTDDEGNEVLDIESQDEIYDEILNTIWEAEDDEDLVEIITDRYSWCVLKIRIWRTK